jgi:hypothetical protein
MGIEIIIPKHIFNGVNEIWRPQTIYNSEKTKYMIYFAMCSRDDQEVIYSSYVNDDIILETILEVLFIPENKLT